MFFRFDLVILTLTLTLHCQVHTKGPFGDHEAVPHSRPYMALLLQDKDSTAVCGAFLLNEEFVLTAASCQNGDGPRTVLLGVHSVNNHDGVQHIPVEQAFPHEGFDGTSYKNDVMLLKLSSMVNFNKNVRPIALADESDVSLPKSCLVSGWGEVESGHSPTVLMEVNVTIIDDEQCAEENVYCSEGLTGPGQGDGGVPLVCEDGKAYGVVSSSIRRRSSRPLINTYTKISVHRRWINFIMTSLKRFNTCHI